MARIDVDLFSLLVCGLLLLDIYQHNEKQALEQNLYLGELISCIVLLGLDMTGWLLDGQTGSPLWIYMLVYVSYYAIHPLPPLLWALYVDYQIFHDQHRIARYLWPIYIPAFLMACLALSNPVTGYLFTIDVNHIYHRGPFFPILVGVLYAYLFYSWLKVLFNRNRVAKRHFVPLLLFPLPPLLGGLLQVRFYGLSFLWSSVTISLLMIYLSIQNHRLHTDYLTGIYNRLHLDRYLQWKIRSSSRENTFSGILLDIDNFKEINDRYGHDVGDEALSITVELIKRGLRKEDFLARYGGDEFMVIVDIQKKLDLVKSVDRIRESINVFNRSTNKPFKLNLSMGYDVYDYDSVMSKDEFLKHIDTLMYADKEYNRQT